MAPSRLRPQTLEEHLIFWPVVTTWALWLLGLLYIVYPLLGMVLAGLGLARWLGLVRGRASLLHRPLPLSVVIWCIGMTAMLVALIAGHIDFELGLTQTIKSTLGWLKGWALMALFPLAGALLSIRPQIIFRASNILGLQTLLLTPALLATAFMNMDELYYVSPLYSLIGAEQVFFIVGGAIPDSGSLGFRLQFFAPWAPAAAFVAAVSFVLALFDKSLFWRSVGVVASVTMCVFTLSRMSIVAIPVVSIAVLALSQAARPAIFVALAPVVALLIGFSEPIARGVDELEAAFTGARADSSRVRATLQSIGRHRWQSEAPVFGHGVVERGPHLVEYMMIGSHHTWVGLLFVKGIVGLLACAIPMLVSIMEMIAKAQRDRLARCALGILLVLGLFSFGENLDILAYLVWPGLLVVGIAARRPFRHPWYRQVHRARRDRDMAALAPA
jgi:hypothetical protein